MARTNVSYKWTKNGKICMKKCLVYIINKSILIKPQNSDQKNNFVFLLIFTKRYGKLYL